MRKFILLVCIILPLASLAKINGDSIIAHVLHLEPPYVLINIPSTDCINCRAGASDVIRRIGSSVGTGKLLILSDEYAMTLYFKKYGEVYKGYKTLINKEASLLLAGNGKSKVYANDGKALKYYEISNINDSVANEIIQMSKGERALTQRVDFTDSLYTDTYSWYAANPTSAMLFSQKFQAANFVNAATGEHNIEEPSVNNAAIKRMESIVVKYHADSLFPPDSALKELDRMTLPQMVIYNFHFYDDTGYTLFFINTVIEEKTGNSKSRRVSVKGRNFVGKMRVGNGSDILKPDNFSELSFIDTIHHNGHLYFPYFFKGFEVKNGSLYVPLRMIEDSMGVMIEKQELFVGKFELKNNQKVALQNLYSYKGSNRPDNFLLRINSAGLPVVVDGSNRNILFCNDQLTIPFSQLNYKGHELSGILDLKFFDGVACLAGLTKDGVVFGKTDLGNTSTSYELIDAQPMLPQAIIVKGKVVVHNRNGNTNSIVWYRW